MDPVNVILVLLILVVAVVLFATEKFPVDLVALLVLGAVLVLGMARGIVTAQEGVSGFSNPATITVAAMFVLSAGLQKTGALRVVGRMLIQFGDRPLVLLTVLMVTIGVVSAFANNTAAVAVFLPLVLAVAAHHKISPSKLLIPLSFASQFGGVCTVIGTSTNLLVSAISEREGYGAFAIFEFAPLGLIMLGVGVAYFLVVGYWLLPVRGGAQLTEAYQLGEYISELRVMAGSPLIGQTIAAGNFGEQHDVTVLEILRGKEKLWSPLAETMREGDVLLVRGRVRNLMDLKATAKLEIAPEFKLKDETLQGDGLILAETLVAAQSPMIGRTLSELDFQKRHNAIVLAIQRRGHSLREKLSTVRLALGDALLLMGKKDEIAGLRGQEHLVVLKGVDEPSLRKDKIPVALAIFAVTVAIAALNIMPIMIAAILGCITLVITRCLNLEEAYQAIDWKVIFLLAGVLPLGIAMENSGAAQWIAKGAVALAGAHGPAVVLAALYLLTVVLTSAMSNNATAVLLAPIAISTALDMGVSPKPFLMAVMFGASTCFATPVGYQTNAMVYNPGGYKFTDFMKIGIPLNLLFWGLAVYFIPRFWPF